jgi:hypothetical protein
MSFIIEPNIPELKYGEIKTLQHNDAYFVFLAVQDGNTAIHNEVLLAETKKHSPNEYIIAASFNGDVMGAKKWYVHEIDNIKCNVYENTNARNPATFDNNTTGFERVYMIIFKTK